MECQQEADHTTLFGLTMPLENEHAARQTDPDGYERFGRKDGPSAGLSFVIGFKQGGGSDIQSIRADASEWEV